MTAHKWKSLGTAFYRKHLPHKPDSEEISKAIREFKAKGGEIELIETKEPEPDCRVPINNEGRRGVRGHFYR